MLTTKLCEVDVMLLIDMFLTLLQVFMQFVYCISYESFYCVSDKIQALYWIQLTAKYNSSHEASYCLEAHEKALNDAIGNLTQPQFDISNLLRKYFPE
jgi:hypothetical protein